MWLWNPVLLSGLVCISNVQGTNNLDQIDFNSPCYFLTRGFRYGPAFNKTISREESHVANIQSTYILRFKKCVFDSLDRPSHNILIYYINLEQDFDHYELI